MSMTQILPLLLGVTLLALPTSAQVVDKRDAFADTETRRAALNKAKEQIHGDPLWDYFTTPNLIVLWEAEAANKGVRAEALAKAEQYATRLQRWWQACEAFLPPDQDSRDVFPVIPLPASRQKTAGGGDIAGLQDDPRRLWGVYRAAWFGDRQPESWFDSLAEAHMKAHAAYGMEEVRRLLPTRPLELLLHDEVAWKQVVKQIRKLPRSAMDDLLSRLEGSFARVRSDDRSLRETEETVTRAWAAFLIQGPKDLGAKFQPAWKGWLIDYARKVRTSGSVVVAEAGRTSSNSGDTQQNTDLRKAALDGWNHKEFEDALAKWAMTAK